MGKDSVGVQFDTVEVSGQMPDKQAASRTFSSEDIRTTPGSVGDPMRTLDLSAEVVSNSDLQAIPIIGGDEADGILTLMDGFPITYPYRMLGSLSLFNPLMTNRIELLTAGYPACTAATPRQQSGSTRSLNTATIRKLRPMPACLFLPYLHRFLFPTACDGRLGLPLAPLISDWPQVYCLAPTVNDCRPSCRI